MKINFLTADNDLHQLTVYDWFEWNGFLFCVTNTTIPWSEKFKIFKNRFVVTEFKTGCSVGTTNHISQKNAVKNALKILNYAGLSRVKKAVRYKPVLN